MRVSDHLLQADPTNTPNAEILEACATLGFLCALTARIRLGAMVITVTFINAWHDSLVRAAVTRTGRNKVIIAGTGLDVCAQLPALASTAEGYDSYVVIDACGRFEPVPSVAAISRLTQAGVAVVNARVIVLEAMADNGHPRANEIYATLPTGLVIMDDGGD